MRYLGQPLNFKREFSFDDMGNRGFLSEFWGRNRTEQIKKEFERKFSVLSVRIGEWPTWYTRDGLIKLMEEVPLIRGFDVSKDFDVINAIEKIFGDDRGIKTMQKRSLVVLSKPRK